MKRLGVFLLPWMGTSPSYVTLQHSVALPGQFTGSFHIPGGEKHRKSKSLYKTSKNVLWLKRLKTQAFGDWSIAFNEWKCLCAN